MTGLLIDKDVENTLTNLAGMKVIVFPLLKRQTTANQIDDPPILNVLNPD